MQISTKIILVFGVFLNLACGNSSGTPNGESSLSKEQYIVVFKRDSISSKTISFSARQAFSAKRADSFSVKYGVKTKSTISSVISAGVYQLSKAQLVAAQRDPNVAYVEKDIIITINSVQNKPVWGLDRIDQQTKSLDKKYEYPEGAGNVNAYIIDTGVRIDHDEFGGRASHGIDTVDGDNDASDCNGHGTHVAGTVGGEKYGVAKDVNIIGVRVLDCRGSGRLSKVIEGVEWVTNNHVKPAVANMSLGGGISQALDDAVVASVASGVAYAVAAGNENSDACKTSPARNSEVITVGASNKKDSRASFSNYGTCVDIFAPGEDIKSSWYNSDGATKTIDGTSMASPHVAGVIALYLSQNPYASPTEVKEKIIEYSVSGALSSIKSGSPNSLVNIEFLNEEDSGGGEEPVGEIPVVDNGQTISQLSAKKGESNSFVFKVPEGSKNLKIEISGSKGDADLYVKKSSTPNRREYDCRPYKSGSNEQCEEAEPEQADYFIEVMAYSDYSELSISVSYEQASEDPVEQAPPCTKCDEYVGEFSRKGEYAYHPDGSYYYQSRRKTHKVWVRPSANSTYKAELYVWSNRAWKKVKTSSQSGVDSYLSYRGSSGYYLVKVISVEGVGPYKLWHIGK